jgi:DNA-binding LacI/PurR family transcriptional regulator
MLAQENSSHCAFPTATTPFETVVCSYAMDIRKVAAKARVSTATVSRTINSSDAVAPATAAKVWAAIRDLNYQPNSHARSLSSGKSHILGLIISDITNPFFPDLVKAFESVAIEHHYEVIVTNTEYSPDRTKLCVNRLLSRKVEGIAIMTSEMEPGLIEQMQRAGVPIVTLDTGIPGKKFSNIRVDYSGGVRQAIHHLVGLRHERIAFIRGPQRLKSAQIRYEAYLKVAKQNSLTTSSSLIADGEHSIDGGFTAMLNLLPQKPTAVVASNDLSAIGALHALQQSNLQVPGEVSIIGFDDINFSRHTRPELTTVRIPRTEISRLAFEALSSTSNSEHGREWNVATELVIRMSTGPCARRSGAQS